MATSSVPECVTRGEFETFKEGLDSRMTELTHDVNGNGQPGLRQDVQELIKTVASTQGAVKTATWFFGTGIALLSLFVGVLEYLRHFGGR